MKLFPEETEEQSKPGDQRNLDLFNFSPVPMFVYDTQSLRFLAANEAAQKELGYTLEEFLTKTVRELWPKEDIPLMEIHIKTKVSKGLPNKATVRFIKKSGEVIFVDAESRPLSSWKKNARIISATNVTEKLSSEAALIESRDQFQSLLQTVEGIVWEAEAETLRFNFVNDYAREILGFGPEEWLNDPQFLQNHIHPDDKEIISAYKSSEISACGSFTRDYRMIRADGETVWIRDNVSLFKTGGGTEKLRGLMVDITTAKRTAEFERLEKDIFELNAKKDISTTDILNYYTRGIEKLFPKMFCSIMHVREQKLYNWASPSLPKAYSDELEGISIGENIGSCGTAAFFKKQVIVTEIETDKRWKNYRGQALQHGLKACWSNPISNSRDEVIATFALYYGKAKAPNKDELKIIERSTYVLQVILENRQYSEDLKESALLIAQNESRLRNLVDSQTNYVIRTDINGRYTYYNRKYKEDFGWLYDQKDFTGYDSIISVVPYHRKNIEKTIEDCLNHPNTVYSVEIDKLAQSGGIKSTYWHFICLTGSDNHPSEIQCIGIDVSDRKKAEEALTINNERYAYVNRATNDAIYDWEIETDRIEWGDAFYRVFGYRAGEKENQRKWEEMVHPDEVEFVKKSMNEALTNPEQHNWTEEYRFERSDGTYAYVEENGYILRDQNEKAIRMIGVLRDITDRKIAETELEASRERYSNLFHLSPQPMFVYDLSTFKFLDVNQATINHYGYSREEFLSMSIYDIRLPEDFLQLDKILADEVKRGVSHSGISSHVKKSGEIILVNTKGNSIVYDDREARIVVAVDNTAKIKAEEALLESERRFKTLIQDGSDLITITEPGGKLKYVSPTVERFLNMKAGDLTGKNAFDFIYEEDRKKVLKRYALLANHKRVELAPYRFINGNNEIRWAETTITDMRNDAAINGIIANSRDITLRMEKDIKIKEHLDRYNTVSKATSDAIWDANMITGELVWNHGIKGIFGHSDVIQNYQWWHDHVHPEDVQRVTELIKQVIQQKEARWTSEYRFRCGDGSYKFVLDRGFVNYNDSGQPLRMTGSMQNITDRVNYINAIEQHNMLLSEIAWTQSHNVRAPLANIMALISLLKEPEHNRETKDLLLSYLEVSADGLDQVIRSIISKSKIDL